MSTVALAPNYRSDLTLEGLIQLAKGWGITFRSEEEAETYLLLLQSAESVYDEIDGTEDYIHPDLEPVTTKDPREFWRPLREQNPQNAWSQRCELQAAKTLSSVLLDRSVVVKDNISVGGLPTTAGAFSKLHSGNDGNFPISPVDATVVRRVLEAGAILKGTATCEMYSAAPLSFTSATGPVDSPWVPGFTCGGSSSGCGCLMGMNVIDPHQAMPFGDRADLAIGGDQGGSIRIPASYNGTYGLKPTHGLVPYTGATSLTPMIDHLGPMASNLRDVATLLQVIAGYDGFDPRMTAESPAPTALPDYISAVAAGQCPSGGTGVRVGILKEAFEIPGVSEEVRTGVYDAATRFFTAAGATVKEVSIPMHLQGPTIWTASTRMFMADWACANQWSGFLSYQPPHVEFRWPPDQEMYDLLTSTNPSIMNLIFSARFLKENKAASLVPKAHRAVYKLRRAYDEALQDVDVLVTPTTPTVAMPHPKTVDEDGSPAGIAERVKIAVGIVTNTCPFNVTGHPAMNVPCGFGTAMVEGVQKKLPIGMQMIGRRWEESVLLRAAGAFDYGRTTLA